MGFQLAIVIIDLRKVRLAVVLDADEVMLAPRIVVVVERIEGSIFSTTAFRTEQSSAATPAVIITRPPQKVSRKASFKVRILTRLACLSSFFPSVLRTYYLRRVTGEPRARRRTRLRLPLQCIAATVAAGRVTTRQGATRCVAATLGCRGRFMRRGNTDAAVAVLAFADFRKSIFRAQLIEAGHKVPRRQRC